MQRRSFLAASAAALVGLGSTAGHGEAKGAAPSERQWFELRTYHFATAEKQAAYEAFLAQGGVAALNRAGVEKVGVFKVVAAENPSMKLTADPAELRVLLVHNSIDSVMTLESRLAADKAYQSGGQAILAAPKSNPAFARYDSTLLLGMEGAPRLVETPKGEGRVFELRTYESPSEERAKNKLEMFNAGEFAVFVKAGMSGVFFGGAVVGQGLPQLTYMVVHANFADVKRNWGAFGKDPDWQKLKAGEGYKDNVSKVISVFVRPTAGSQV